MFSRLGLPYAFMILNHPDWIVVVSSGMFLIGIQFLIGCWLLVTNLKPET
jgi:hypothetical protein